MKTKILLYFLLSTFTFLLVEAQVPQGFNYQAIARDAAGNPIVSSTLQVKLAVMADSSGTTVLWEELHNPVNTNAFGLFTLVLGKGVRQLTSMLTSFNSIDWSVTPRFLRAQVYYQSTWKTMGITRMWSVPYAIEAKSVTGPVPRLKVSGATTSADSILFEVKNKTGQTVFAVYNEGVRIYVDDGVAKGTKGGFAIGGFGAAKAPSQEYFRVTRDSTRVYVNQLAKPTKGGFAIGGFNPAKGADNNFLNVSPDNYFIGLGAGKSNTTGIYNSFLGYRNGYNNTSGGNNVFLGYQSGYANTTGSSNVIIGNLAGQMISSSTANIFIGNGSAQNATTGSHNVIIGSLAGAKNAANYNIFLGNYSGLNNTSGTNNFFAGLFSGASNRKGSSNIYIGNLSGFADTTGNNNIFMGDGAGRNNMGSSNIIMGYQAGYFSTTGDFNLFLGNQAGAFNTGHDNTFIGLQSGYSNQGGSENVFIGILSGGSNTSGSNNTYIGNRSGYLSTTSNRTIAIGPETGYYNAGASNIFVGYQSGYNNTTGMQNLFMGTQAGVANTTGYNNIFLGVVAGQFNTTGAANVFIGTSTGYKNTTGMYNTSLGNLAGANNQTGSSNIFIGNMAGMNELGSNRLYIDNTSADKDNALIYGEFDNNFLAVNGNLGIGRSVPATRLDIAGGNWNVAGASEGDFRVGDASYRLKIGVATAGGGAGDVRITAMGGTNRMILGGNGVDVLAITNTNIYPWSDNAVPLGLSSNRFSVVYAANGTINTSDARLKENISELAYGLESILKLRPVSFTWKGETGGKQRLGLLAQDVEKVIDEVVDHGTDPDQTLGINYSEIVPVLIKGIQEQQVRIEDARKEISDLKSELQLLREEIAGLKTGR